MRGDTNKGRLDFPALSRRSLPWRPLTRRTWSPVDILADGTRRSGPHGAPVSVHGIYLEMSLVCEGHA
ncbi:MAG: hypothetical protein M3Q27_07340 [Actinomycetota bacterium]|nr:hypothetical protein [Actinomycetota bacterium]